MKNKEKNSIRIYSWNVNGIRAVQKKGFADWINTSEGDIFCLQETKIQPDQLTDEIANINGFKSHWFSAQRKGYSSVAIYTSIEPIKIIKGFNKQIYDSEGRVIFAEYDKFVLANVYFPNGGRGPERVKYKLDFYDELFFLLNKNYKGRKGIIVTGDYNTAHKEIDVAKPKEWSRKSGFLPEEREWIDRIINLGYTDVLRKFNDKPDVYTYWDNVTFARETNTGWRIDFFMVSEDLMDNIIHADVHPDVMGSDHCPISIDIKL
jgi:exodeoxyribonuclease III